MDRTHSGLADIIPSSCRKALDVSFRFDTSTNQRSSSLAHARIQVLQESGKRNLLKSFGRNVLFRRTSLMLVGRFEGLIDRTSWFGCSKERFLLTEGSGRFWQSEMGERVLLVFHCFFVRVETIDIELLGESFGPDLPCTLARVSDLHDFHTSPHPGHSSLFPAGPTLHAVGSTIWLQS